MVDALVAKAHPRFPRRHCRISSAFRASQCLCGFPRGCLAAKPAGLPHEIGCVSVFGCLRIARQHRTAAHLGKIAGVSGQLVMVKNAEHVVRYVRRKCVEIQRDDPAGEPRHARRVASRIRKASSLPPVRRSTTCAKAREACRPAIANAACVPARVRADRWANSGRPAASPGKVGAQVHVDCARRLLAARIGAASRRHCSSL